MSGQELSAFDRTRSRVVEIMCHDDVRGFLQSQCEAPDGGGLQFWQVNGHVVIVWLFRCGGCHHYLPSMTTTWEGMQEELERLG